MKSSLKPILEFSLESETRYCQVTPLRIGEDRALLAIHSDCASIDPFHRYFTLPTDTVKLTAFSIKGEQLWRRDLGPGMIPGLWFLPVFPFDLDGDGTDEIYLVNNADPIHPFNHEAFILEQMSSTTGEVIGSIPWPASPPGERMSHTYRNFINGGFSGDHRRLITAQGTYGDMSLQCWDESLGEVWTRLIGRDEPGCRGSHMFPMVDLDGDGNDEILYGERCIDIDTGKDMWIADAEGWRGHSDVVQPVLDPASGTWLIYTCRESPAPPEARGVVMYDAHGQELWGHRGMAHVHDGWAARLCDDGSHLFYALELDDKGKPFREYLYALQGNPLECAFPLAKTLPVDINGDGLHELVYRTWEHVGLVIDRHGEELARLDGNPSMYGKVFDIPGEQVITWSADGLVRAYACDCAEDSEAAKRRYDHPLYEASMRLWAVGYNWRNLGGL